MAQVINRPNLKRRAFSAHYSRRVLCFLYAGERLTDPEVEQILKYTGTEEDLDGNIKYEGQ